MSNKIKRDFSSKYILLERDESDCIGFLIINALDKQDYKDGTDEKTILKVLKKIINLYPDEFIKYEDAHEKC